MQNAMNCYYAGYENDDSLRALVQAVQKQQILLFLLTERCSLNGSPALTQGKAYYDRR